MGFNSAFKGLVHIHKHNKCRRVAFEAIIRNSTVPRVSGCLVKILLLCHKQLLAITDLFVCAQHLTLTVRK